MVAGLIAAAGRGERLGGARPKALVRLAGKPLVGRAAAAIAPACDLLVVAVPADADPAPFREALAECGVVARVCAGGAARSLSVKAALREAEGADRIVVHDAARPFATPALVQACLDALAEADAAIAAVPLTDTVKESRDGRFVDRTLDRSRLWAVQTPQAFRRSALERALARPDRELAAATDEASLVERDGGRVRLVASTPRNLKITVPADLELAEALLACRTRTGVGSEQC